MVAATKNENRGTRHVVVAMPKRGINAPFRRSVRDGKGKIVETMIFPRGEPVELNDTQFAAIADDIGKGAIKAYDAERPNTPAAIRERIERDNDEAAATLAAERHAADKREKEYRDEGLPI